MRIDQTGKSLFNIPENQPKVKSPGGEEFGDMLAGFIKGVNDDQVKSKEMLRDFTAGEDVELHQVMIAGQKAKTSLEMLMEIRNKSIDMYRELTRMQ